jgi:hypothetical protein
MRFICVLSFVAATSAFATLKSGRRSCFGVLKERADASAAIAKANDAAAKFGANSPEARLAWETVEEIEGRDNR